MPKVLNFTKLSKLNLNLSLQSTENEDGELVDQVTNFFSQSQSVDFRALTDIFKGKFV
jgi:hypothetical protein